MQNIKNFSSAVVICILKCSLVCAYSFTGLKEFGQSTEKIAPQLCKTADSIAGTIVGGMGDASKIFGADAARILGENGLRIVKEVTPELADASSKLGVEAGRQVGVEAAKIVTPVLAVGVAVYGTVQLYPIGKEIYERNFPTEEQKASQEGSLEAAQRRLSLLKSEREYRECLLNIMNKKIKVEINDLGRPAICEESASILEMLGAQAEVDRMTEVFMRHRK